MEGSGAQPEHRSGPRRWRPRRWRPRRWEPRRWEPRRWGLGAVAGVLAGGAALGVGQLIAGITGASTSPVVAVGQLQIDFTPPWLKNFAIREFGSHDKQVLVGGILVVLAIFAACIGALATRRLAYGVAGIGVFAVVGLTAAASRPGATFRSMLPTLFAVATAVAVLRVLVGELLTQGSTAGAPAADPPPDSGRRNFLAAAGVTAGVAALAGLIGRELTSRSSVAKVRSTLRIPKPSSPAAPLAASTSMDIPGISSFITPNGSFYRVDTAIVVPQVSPDSWQLRIHGMVSREITLTFDELIRRPLVEDYITLCCVSNPVAGPYIGNALWLGTSLASVLRSAGIRAGADQLLCTSADGFTSGTPVQTVMDGREALLAVAMNGQPLPVEHGFPVRMVVPGLYGYVSATKWVTDIEVTTFAGNAAYWAQRGWSQQAPIKTESRIDVPAGNSPLRAGRVTVAGVAWAQHKGIDAVEVRAGSGPWHQARLAAVPGIDCWRQWAWDWDATPGNYVLQARATDATGYTQTAVQEAPEPDGASGYPSVQVTVR
jgi:DMSO/TMAO reductase YedYZ molybdopterin-dependent catalytic subunit